MADAPTGSGAGQPHRRGQPTSLSLLERARARDAAAWRRMVELYRPLVRFWCARGGLRGPDAEDVAQEVLAAAFAGLDGFRRDRPGDTFRGWLRGITRNQVLLHFRRGRGRARAAGGSEAGRHLRDVPDPLAGVEEEEAAEVSRLYRRALEQVRNEFGERTWRAFWRAVVDGRAPAELEQELGMTAAAVRQAKSRVLRRLKQEVGDLLD
jgi:RNA polymerase sigma-70 factor (ECF subfamily)